MYDMTDKVEGLPAYFKYLDTKATAQHIKKRKRKIRWACDQLNQPHQIHTFAKCRFLLENQHYLYVRGELSTQLII
jgi:hypothetical protein